MPWLCREYYLCWQTGERPHKELFLYVYNWLLKLKYGLKCMRKTMLETLYLISYKFSIHKSPPLILCFCMMKFYTDCTTLLSFCLLLIRAGHEYSVTHKRQQWSSIKTIEIRYVLNHLKFRIKQHDVNASWNGAIFFLNSENHYVGILAGTADWLHWGQALMHTLPQYHKHVMLAE